MKAASGQGMECLRLLLTRTSATEQMTRSMAEKVEALKGSTGSIVRILDLLNGLSKQTNILALNATIEAVRAGNAGKAFMVVADEIRILADKSRQSIHVVGGITEQIGREIDETVRVLSEAYPLFQDQLVAVKEADRSFMDVQRQMEPFTERLELVTASVSRLSSAQEELAAAMANVSAVAEQSSAATQEVASLCTGQLAVSNELVRLSGKLESVSRELQNGLSRYV